MTTPFLSAHVTLPSDREVRVQRSFKAPRELVFEAFTTPELVQRWQLGPPGWSMPVCEMDVRPGGAYRWRWRNDADGSEFGFFGTFQEVEPPARIVHSERYDPGDIGGAMPADEPALITVELVEHAGVTTVTTTMRFASKEARDGAVSTGMTDGMEMGYQRLDGMLAERL
jgi:uncharacterized protein YndB with AHSA1/START domain